MNAITFLQERSRLTNNCAIKCEECRLSTWNNGKECSCSDLEHQYSELCVSIVQQWSEDCPQRTCKDVFLEAFPNAKMSERGEPSCCLGDLGTFEAIDCSKFNSCLECWNQAVK